MPTYEYGCLSCGHQFELEQRITEPPASKCPKCGKKKAQRLVSQGNFILKGGGWYADLYSSPRPGSKSSDDSGSVSSSSSDGGSTEPSSSKSGAKDSSAKDSSKKATGSKPSGSGGKKKSSGKASAAA